MKPLGLGEDAVDQRLRHAVPGQIEEADILQREAQFRRGGFQRPWRAGEIGGDIEQRDLVSCR